MMSKYEKLKTNPIFKYLASVKLAVPLMLVIAAVIAVGTVVESRYNAEVASLLVYRAWWFQALMGVLGLNVFLAAAIRYPFKEKHTGFVITHAGMLILLGGAVLTWQYGIDGSLRIVEGQDGRSVALPELTVKVASMQAASLQSYPFKRRLEPANAASLPFGNLRAETGLIVEKYEPFVTREQSWVEQPGAPDGAAFVGFSLHSQMFGDVNEWLHSRERPDMQLGPAVFRVLSGEEEPAAPKPVKKAKTAERPASVPKAERALAAEGALLVVKDAQGKELAQLKVAELKKKKANVNGITIQVTRVLEQAVVGDANKLEDGGQKGVNPALELQLVQQGKALREVSYAKFPSFTLGGGQTVGLQFEYRLPGVTADAESESAGMPAGHPPLDGGMPSGAAPAARPMMTMGGGTPASNTIDFHVLSTGKDAGKVRIDLHKDGKKVFSQVASAGERVTTPWMGMAVSIQSVMTSAVISDAVRPIALRERSPLPESAIFVRAESAPVSEGTWITEGDFKTVRSGDKAYEVYYGTESVELPFSLSLEKFEKIDYPGTQTPMSFQSTVKVNGAGDPILISMNEPLKHQGFTLYQSSYEMGQGPTASIFSVNRDPGRPVKYAGSLVLCLGIALYMIMKSKWYNDRKQRTKMKTSMAVVLLSVLSLGLASNEARAETQQAPQAPAAVSAADALAAFKAQASRVDPKAVAELPVQSHGRLKPFQSFAREAILYVTGKYSLWGFDATQLYIGLMTSNVATSVELINIRDPQLRTKLGFDKKQRAVSLEMLEKTQLEQLAQPAMARAERNDKSMTPEEKAIMETMQQVWLTRGIISGRHLIDAMNISQIMAPNSPTGMGTASGPVFEKMQAYLQAVMSASPAADSAAKELVTTAKTQPMPELFQKNIDKLGLEVWYNKAHLFRWSAVGYALIGLFLLLPVGRRKLTPGKVLALVALPFLAHIGGFATRVVITGFAPVTNMYGTMIWVAFGVTLFGGMLFAAFKNYVVYGFLLLGAAATLILTESLPLVLSPDMDPIVAVLRNNFWLTIHVLTITISYAAFTIAMLLGNVALIKSIFSRNTDDKLYVEYGNLAYRVIQLGVLFLTAGIILGGVWADYSWGRFWGWDPKETWSLIADLGFLTILHARYVGWIGNFGLLAASPIGYLLVVMAWYGVNFILAAGLHSYGFSSGGAAAVAGFVAAQLAILAVALFIHRWRKAEPQKAA